MDITRDDELYRRVSRSHVRADGSIKPSAFIRNSSAEYECSVYLARLARPDDVVAACTAEFPMGVATIVAAVPIDMGLDVYHDPNDVVGTLGHAHSVVRGMTSYEQCARLANQATIVINPRAAPE